MAEVGYNAGPISISLNVYIRLGEIFAVTGFLNDATELMLSLFLRRGNMQRALASQHSPRFGIVVSR